MFDSFSWCWITCDDRRLHEWKLNLLTPSETSVRIPPWEWTQLLLALQTLVISSSDCCISCVTQFIFMQQSICLSHVSSSPLRCGVCKRTNIPWELFQLKPLVQPKQTRGDKLEVESQFEVKEGWFKDTTAPFSCCAEDTAHLVCIASHIIMKGWTKPAKLNTS